ncbi:hypothetical protein BAY59_11165 [Prauserella coralliicola]|nr:hypothetical protein BAY59_11165 [Prauserella coralliicola]
MVATGGEGGTPYERLRRAGHEALATGNVEQAAEAFGQAARLAHGGRRPIATSGSPSAPGVGSRPRASPTAERSRSIG